LEDIDEERTDDERGFDTFAKGKIGL